LFPERHTHNDGILWMTNEDEPTKAQRAPVPPDTAMLMAGWQNDPTNAEKGGGAPWRLLPVTRPKYVDAIRANFAGLRACKEEPSPIEYSSLQDVELLHFKTAFDFRRLVQDGLA
jgi:hypothetical protein